MAIGNGFVAMDRQTYAKPYLKRIEASKVLQIHRQLPTINTNVAKIRHNN